MKRKEMIYLMVESMEYWQDSLSKFGGGIPAMMDYVLEQQEKAGMLPPVNFNHRMFTEPDEYEREQGGYVSTADSRGWEPEDD